MNIVSISASPAQPSRSTWLLQLALTRLESESTRSFAVHVPNLPAAALLAADTRAEAIAWAIRRVLAADMVLIATPICQAAYSGLLKIFLDVLPPDALRGKTVLPLATGDSAAHWPATQDALGTVLSALGARDIRPGVFAADTELVADEFGGYLPDRALTARLERALWPLATPQQEPLLRRCA